MMIYFKNQFNFELKMRKFFDKYGFFFILLFAVSVVAYLSSELVDNFEQQRKLEEQAKELKYYSPDTPVYYKRIQESSILLKRH